MPKPRLHLTHMQAVLQTDYLYEIIPDVCGQSKYTTLLKKVFYSLLRRVIEVERYILVRLIVLRASPARILSP